MPTAFEFPYRTEDFVEKLLRDHPELEQWRSVFNEYASTEQSRDEDLEDYLDSDSISPGIGVSRAAVQSVAHNTSTALAFDTLNFQSTDLFTWDSGDPTKLVVNQSGIITVTVNARFFAAAGGVLRFVQALLSGLVEITANTPANPNPNEARGSASVTWSVVAGDYIELYVLHDAGAPLNVKGTLQVSYGGHIG